MHPRQQLGLRQLRPKKSFGQNFLHDDHHLGRIAALVTRGLGEADPVVELGGGTGALTAQLVAHPGPVHVVERDRDMVPILQDRFAQEVEDGRLTVHEASATTFDLRSVFEGHPGALCGNLPYHLTSELLERTCEVVDHLHRAIFLIQLEVAERICAEPGNKTWGALSVNLQAMFSARRALVVPKGAFWPAPEVDGGVIELVPLSAEQRARAPLSVLRPIVKVAFAQRRKRLSNALKKRPDALDAMRTLGIDVGQRPEMLTVDAWTAVAEAVKGSDPQEDGGA
jgi:16S rRNA (adenine1518-N6/adenine1519-N6)-dimethyltransferase